MTVGANSYGTAAGVAAYVSRYASSGTFNTTTRPTLTQVEGWIDQVSAILNVALAKEGFAIPVTNADAVSSLKSITEPAVADLCHYANSAGRFFTDRALERGVSPMMTIRAEMGDWVAAMAAGLELLGADRTHETASGILYDDEAFPIFQREAFSNEFTDWSGE